MKVALLGCGNMGRAIISGLQKKYDDIAIIAYDKNDAALTSLPDAILVIPPEEWYDGDNTPDAVIIAVKPQDIEQSLIPLLAGAEKIASVLWISIAAGISIAALEGYLSPASRICRVMPNTPALIGEAMSAYACNSNCSDDDMQLADDILSACGKCINVPEKQMNAVTGLSGSGPAYVYLFIEALIEGGVAAGLPYATAKECAVQTVIGAARMVEQSEENPSALKAKVTSPAGTTAKGLLALEKNNFKYAVIEAVAEATHRSEELGRASR
jgi:pyrroline-5-carboxylate reductase